MTGPFVPLDEYPPEEFLRVLRVDLVGVWHCMRAEIRHMRRQGGGATVNTSSMLGSAAMADNGAYVAAEHGVHGPTRADVAAVRRLLVTGPRWEAALPVAGTAVAGYVLYRNVGPVPPAPYRWFPYAVLVWLALAGLATVLVPGLVARVGAGVARAGDRGSEEPERAGP